MKKINSPLGIFICDNHSISRNAIRCLLSSKTGLRVIGESKTAVEAIPQLSGHEPDILLLNSFGSYGLAFETISSLRESGKNAKAIVLGDSGNREEIAEFFERGAYGFVDRESSSRVLFDAIKAVMAGKYWVGTKAVSRRGERIKKSPRPLSDSHQTNYGLTPRELDVIKVVISGCTNKEIAGQLTISEQTVKHHITNIFDKLGVYNRLELTLFVLHHGLVED